MADNEIGKQTYAICQACHGPDGKGVANLGPPLADNQWVTGPVENLIRIQLRGIQGPITIKEGVTWSESPLMAPNAYLSDEQIAGVINYIRNSWGNEGSTIEAGDVLALRDEVGQPMLKEEELVKPVAEVDEVIEEMPAKDLPEPPQPDNASGLPTIAWIGLLAYGAVMAATVLKGYVTRNN